MRILKGILLVSSCMLFGIYNVSADELTDCLTSESSTCELSSDVTLTEAITIVGNKTLILNEFNINDDTASLNDALFNIGSGSSLTVSGTGKITNKGVVFKVNGGMLTVNSGTYSSINKAVILETAGSVVFNGGSVFGKTGIEVQGGSLITTGSATSNDQSNRLGKNAASVDNVLSGVGIAVVKGKTSNPITVTINGGNYNGFYAFYESDLGTGSNNATLTINGGTFRTTFGGSSCIKAESLTQFINGGTFYDRPDDFETYLADETELNGNTVVSKKYAVDVRASINGSVTTDVARALPGATVRITVTPDSGYELDTLKVYKVSNDSEVLVSNKSFVMPDEAVYVVATFKEVTVVTPTKDIVVNTKEPDEDNTFGVLSSITTEIAYRNTLAEIIKNEDSINEVELTLNTDDITDTMNTSYPGGINKITSYVERISNTAVILKYYEVSMDISVEELRSKVLNKNLTVNYKIIIPEESQKANRKYFVIGYDGNNAYTVNNATLDASGEYILFSSNKYDVFALMYTDGEFKPVDTDKPVVNPSDNNKPNDVGTVNNPNTYDDIYKYFYINGFATLGLLSIAITYKKKCR